MIDAPPQYEHGYAFESPADRDPFLFELKRNRDAHEAERDRSEPGESTLLHRFAFRPNRANARESAELQGIPLASLIRTVVIRRAADDYLFLLVPGGRRLDWARLRAHLGVSRLSLPDAEEARAATGYERGAITPFASRTAWPVIADASVLEPDVVAIGGGARGVNVHMSPRTLVELLGAEVADVTAPAAEAG